MVSFSWASIFFRSSFRANSLALLSLLLRDEGDFFFFLNSREGWQEGWREGGGSSLNLILFSLLLLSPLSLLTL